MIIITLILYHYYSGQTSNENSKFYYNFKYQNDSLNENSKMDYLFVLIKKGDSTLYSEVNNIRADSLENSIYENYKTKPTSIVSFKGIPKAKFQYYIFKNLNDPEAKIMIHDKIGTSNFAYEDEVKFVWHLKNENKIIGGYVCQRAETVAFGRKWIAWFAKDIPINDGPYKFRNLPGLIFEIYDEKRFFEFSLISHIRNDKNLDLKISNLRKNKLITTSKGRFMDAKKDYRSSVVTRLKSSILSDQISGDRIREIQESQKRNNNFIE